MEALLRAPPCYFNKSMKKEISKKVQANHKKERWSTKKRKSLCLSNILAEIIISEMVECIWGCLYLHFSNINHPCPVTDMREGM